MAKIERHKWEFRARFRLNAFGWKSQPAIKRIKEAVSEIKKVARKDPALAADGAVLLLEKLSPALERIDSSSGAIGTAVNNAITALVSIIATAPADNKTREAWLERLWEAYQEDAMPYIEILGDCWGALCASKEIASRWADELIGTCKMAWSPDPALRGFFKGTTNCLSALLAAERYDELLALLEMAPYKMWHYREYGVKALAATGNKAEAIALARRTPCSPQTLTRAARDFEEKNPTFALEAGMTALMWLVQGYGYEITGADVHSAYASTIKAAEHAGVAEDTKERIRALVSKESFGERFVTKILGRHLGLT